MVDMMTYKPFMRLKTQKCVYFSLTFYHRRQTSSKEPSSKCWNILLTFPAKISIKIIEFLRRKEFSIHMSQIPGKGGAEVLDVNDSDSVAAASEMHKFFGPQKFVRSECKT